MLICHKNKHLFQRSFNSHTVYYTYVTNKKRDKNFRVINSRKKFNVNIPEHFVLSVLFLYFSLIYCPNPAAGEEAISGLKTTDRYNQISFLSKHAGKMMNFTGVD